jgi:hypothetical protein
VRGAVPIAVLLFTVGARQLATQHPLWAIAAATSGTVLVIYLVTWLLARRIQVSEDRSVTAPAASIGSLAR